MFSTCKYRDKNPICGHRRRIILSVLLRKAVFRVVKDRLPSCKRPSFTTQKVAFCKAGGNVLAVRQLRMGLQTA